MNHAIHKIAGSTLIAAMTLTGSTGPSPALARGGFEVHRAQGDAARQAAEFQDQAARALRQGQVGAALAAMEQAVALSPRDAGFRLLLADLYLKSGRLDSARATYADVLELDPSQTRAGLGLALMQIALGHPHAAVGVLDDFADRAAPSDLGLAYALAGETTRAIRILEPAARSTRADARTRQNLALSYALAGDWRRARAIAAQDVAPADLSRRMEQWAAFARPGANQTRIAGLLGVQPVQDPGQPVALALRASTPDVQVAAADPSSVPAPVQPPVVAQAAPVMAPVVEPAPTSVQIAALVPTPAPVSDWGTAPAGEALPEAAATPAPAYASSHYAAAAAPAPAAPIAPVAKSAQEVRYAEAARTLARPSAALVRASAVSLPAAPVLRRAAIHDGDSPYVVQLGAFSNDANAERAWLHVRARFGLTGRAPLTATIDMNGRTLYRVSIAGFAARGDAVRACEAIKSQDGECFVRTRAGDASIRWAAHYALDRSRRA